MFPGILLTKSEARLLPKGVPSWGRKRGSGPSTCLSGKVLAWILLPKRVFKCQFFIYLKMFLPSGTKSIIMCRLALGMESCVVTSRTQQLNTPLERASWYMLRQPSVFYLKRPLTAWTLSHPREQESFKIKTEKLSSLLVDIVNVLIY